MKYHYDRTVSDRNLRQNDVIKFLSPEENPEFYVSTAGVVVALDELAMAELKRFGNNRVLDLSESELPGSQAYETTYVENGENRTLKAKSIFTLKDDLSYLIFILMR
jgi:hypothetical protein